MNQQAIKQLYDEANRLFEQAKTIRLEFQGKELPVEKTQEIDALLDQVEAKSAEAKRLERLDEAEKMMNDPATRLSMNMQLPDGAKVKWQGRELDAEEIAEMKSGAYPAFIAALSPEYAKAYSAYMRKGAGRLSEEQLKALSVGTAAEGGYLVQDTYLSVMIVKERERSAMRRICRVLPPVPSGAVITPTEDSVFSDATWTTELLTGSADTVQPFGQRKLQPHALAKRVLVSNTFFRTPGFDVDGFVTERLGYKFGITEEDAFVNGDGVNKPLGLKQTAGLPTRSTAASNVVTADDIINWIYTLPATYAAQSKIMCNRAFLRKVRQLKDGLGQYVWQPGLAPGMPNSILDIPYETSDRYDDGLDGNDVWEDNALPAIVGDFSYFWVVDALSMSIQRLVELYAASNQTGFIGRKESDGMCVLPEAFVALKIKA